MNRKEQYRITNTIVEREGKRFFVKTIQNKEAQAFIKDILWREKLAEDFFKGHAKVVRGNLEEGNIYYPYLELPTLESLIAKFMQEGNDLKELELIFKYIEMIKSLPSQHCLPSEFMKEFGIDEKEISEPLNCLLMGPIDLIPSNILVGPEAWYVIDHEWMFEFPVPELFIIYRGIYSLTIHLQKEIQSCISIHNPVVLFCGYGKNRTYIPIRWLEFLIGEKFSLKKLAYWEFLFQRKVIRDVRPTRIRVKKKLKLETSIGTLFPWIRDLICIPIIFKQRLTGSSK